MSDLVERLRIKSTDCHTSEEALYDEAADEILRLRSQLVKRTEALAAIEKVCADLERIMCLPDVKQLKHIWYTARDALIDDQRRDSSAREEPMAYYVEHPTFGVELSLDPPSERAIENGWVGTPLFAQTSAKCREENNG